MPLLSFSVAVTLTLFSPSSTVLSFSFSLSSFSLLPATYFSLSLSQFRTCLKLHRQPAHTAWLADAMGGSRYNHSLCLPFPCLGVGCCCFQSIRYCIGKRKRLELALSGCMKRPLHQSVQVLTFNALREGWYIPPLNCRKQNDYAVLHLSACVSKEGFMCLFLCVHMCILVSYVRTRILTFLLVI